MKRLIISTEDNLEPSSKICLLYLLNDDIIYKGIKTIDNYSEKIRPDHFDHFEMNFTVSDQIFEKIKKLNFNLIRKMTFKEFCKKYELEEILI